MAERIAKEILDKAFDERFPQDMKEKLQNARVAVAGLGGLGSNIAVMLARSGVGHLFLVDFDVVDVTNLNRQMYMIPQLGKPKTEAILEILHDINPYLDVKTKNIKVTSDMVPELFGEYPIVCEAFDNADQKAMLISALLEKCHKTIVVSGNGMAGYGNSNAIVTEKVLGRLYICGDKVTEATTGMGLMAPRVAICAGHEANKVIELILQN